VLRGRRAALPRLRRQLHLCIADEALLPPGPGTETVYRTGRVPGGVPGLAHPAN
jgi:hypothetical protein